MNLRSLYNKYFGNKPSNIQGSTDFKLLNDFVPTFYNYQGNLYDSAIVRSCIHTIASHISNFTLMIKDANIVPVWAI